MVFMRERGMGFHWDLGHKWAESNNSKQHFNHIKTTSYLLAFDTLTNNLKGICELTEIMIIGI